MFDLDNISNKTLFNYIIISITILCFFKTKDIKINFIFGFCICMIIIYYINNKTKQKKEKNDKILEEKTKIILPTPKNSNQYEEILNYLYSIQDFYIYNPQSYIEFIDNLDIFFDNYEVSQINPNEAGNNYNVMNNYKRAVMNSLQSLIHTIPSNIFITKKLNDAIQQIELLLNVYLDKTERTYNIYVFNNGFNINTKIIEKHKLPSNSFDNKDFSNNYDISKNYSIY
jgi:hypothetical protein